MSNRIYIPSYPTPANGGGVQPGFKAGGFGGGGGESPPTHEDMTMPYVSNLENDIVGENEATLEAKPSHYNVGGSSITVQLDDYSTMPAILNNAFTNVVANAGNDNCFIQQAVNAGKGFVPSDDNVALLETVLYSAGSGGQIDCYLQSSTNDGILVGFTGSQFFLDTRIGGVGTRKATWASGLSSSPFGSKWFYFGVQYNQGNDAVHCRIIELGAADNEDTGWKFASVSSPTFGNNEWTVFSANAKSGTTAVCGNAQLRIAEAVLHGYGLGANETHNYIVP